MGISGPPQNVCSECPFTEGGLSRREAETQRIQMYSLCASAAPREIFSSRRGKRLNPHAPTDSPPQRQRRCAIQPGVARASALPRVQAAARSLPRKGLCRSCPPGGATNKGGMGSCSRVRKGSPPGMYVTYPHIQYHPFEPSAQPRWGCLCLWPLPGVAPRRRNPGLYGRIPLGFPEGRWATCNLGDSRRGNGDEPSSGVSGWRNWATSIPTVMIPLGFPEGRCGNARPSNSRRGNGDGPSSGVSMHIMGHRPHHFPHHYAEGVVPYSPGLRRPRGNPGEGPDCPATPRALSGSPYYPKFRPYHVALPHFASLPPE